jgi:hypothetical protein
LAGVVRFTSTNSRLPNADPIALIPIKTAALPVMAGNGPTAKGAKTTAPMTSCDSSKNRGLNPPASHRVATKYDP